jgi:hypothetical protein
LAEHWAGIPRHIFQACPVWIYTQSNITSDILDVYQNRDKSFIKRLIPVNWASPAPYMLSIRSP